MCRCFSESLDTRNGAKRTDGKRKTLDELNSQDVIKQSVIHEVGSPQNQQRFYNVSRQHFCTVKENEVQKQLDWLQLSICLV
jgi:hypothetical protein